MAHIRARASIFHEHIRVSIPEAWPLKKKAKEWNIWKGSRQMPSAASASISEMTASFNCIIMASEVARGLSVITNHAFPSSMSPFVEVARCERSVHTILFVLLAASIHANVSDPEATRLAKEKLFWPTKMATSQRQSWCVCRNNKVSYSNHESGTEAVPLSAYRVIQSSCTNYTSFYVRRPFNDDNRKCGKWLFYLLDLLCVPRGYVQFAGFSEV